MLRHVVLFRLRPDTTDDQREEILAGLRALPDQIPEIRDYQVGADAGLRDAAYDVGVVGLFDDEAGWRTYLEHPAHVAVATGLIRPRLTEHASIQFTS